MEPKDQSSHYFNLLHPDSFQSQHYQISSNNFFHNPVLPNIHDIHVQAQTISPNTSSLSHDHSQLDHCQDNYYHHQPQNPWEIDGRRIRRLVSNRESARRSRMRRKKQIEELQFQVDQLMKFNHQLSDKVVSLLENNQQILQENTQLKERLSSFHILVADTITIPRRNMEKISANYMNRQ